MDRLRNFFLLFLSAASTATATWPEKPHAFIQTVIKDPTTNLYFTSMDIGTNKTVVSLSLVIDLSQPYTWFDCFSGYYSVSYTSIDFHSPKCKLPKFTNPHNVPKPDWYVCSGAGEKVEPGCSDHPCGVNPYNPVDNTLLNGSLSEDRMFFYSIPDGLSFGYRLNSPPVIFACVGRKSYNGFPAEAQGMLSLSRNPLSLPSQLSSAVNLFPQKFALCLPSKTEDSGFGDLFIGGGPYFLPPYQEDASRLFTTVSLITNAASSDEYFFQVKSIKIDEKVVPLRNPILSKLSTVVPFTVLHHSIYEAFVKEFKAKALLKKMVETETMVSPFELCYRMKKSFKMEDVPVIDLTVGSGDGRWRIYGWNSMVVVKKGVMCLAFVRGGSDREEIVIGGYQMEDNLVEIDLQSSKLSFTSSLLRYNTSCSHFRPISTDWWRNKTFVIGYHFPFDFLLNM
ncbi:Xylanase inhibitor C-terminal [Arabidopsis suecica]|uniref:Xylanase inhibitor C-terminal n=1 Tax=Arabidopsis suecica TaxID=45249 RepID=A0A8T1ZCK6_ARASU|nr:Xylanase inhibitor C-terminal [Arabidopsis suecica]